jgi:dimeric dUTPase (all-alpha-NTP-PPase superfamily)
MQLKKIFEIQKELDQFIIKSQGLEGEDLVDRKILALQVELGELANETRCFKFWSKKGPSSREIILEEFVDCLHFILSIGLDRGFEDIEQIYLSHRGVDQSKQFQQIFLSIGDFTINKTKENYIRAFTEIMNLAQMLGFTYEEIFESYVEKNKTNHQRQKEGY